MKHYKIYDKLGHTTFSVEPTTDRFIYTLSAFKEGEIESTLLTIHLPSKRVSERRYDPNGKLIQYVHHSPSADEYLDYLPKYDNKLANALKTVNGNENRKYHWLNFIIKAVKKVCEFLRKLIRPAGLVIVAVIIILTIVYCL